VATLVRAYSNIADELESAGYSPDDIARIKGLIDRYLALRNIIRQASGESLDTKAYEADMRYLIDTYIRADRPQKISAFGNLPLIELIVETGIADAIVDRLGNIQNDHDAVGEAIENNVRRKIIREALNDPAYFARMSE
jgi:type I restriction enzyme R subunit